MILILKRIKAQLRYGHHMWAVKLTLATAQLIFFMFYLAL